MKTRIITVANNKGGVGETTTVVNLAAGLAQRGRRGLVIDSDPEENAAVGLLGPGPHRPTLYDALIANTAGIAELVIPARTRGVDLIPSNINLSAADITLASIPGRERLLARKLKMIGGYDYILIDTPPSLDILTVNSLTT